jgi:hypothetical protein
MQNTAQLSAATTPGSTPPTRSPKPQPHRAPAFAASARTAHGSAWRWPRQAVENFYIVVIPLAGHPQARPAGAAGDDPGRADLRMEVMAVHNSCVRFG